MATQKRFIAKNGLDNNGLSIINVADPTNAQDVATKAFVLASGGGVSSVNTRTGAVTLTSADVGLGSVSNTAQVTSVTGTSPVISSGGTTPAISMAAATASVSGYLTSTDWNTFNNKQVALGFTPIQQGGGTGQGTNKLYIGWASSVLQLQVDATNFGSNWPISITGTATIATNVAAGVAGSVPYQTSASTTAMTAASTVAGQVLTTVTAGGAPTWQSPVVSAANGFILNAKTIPSSYTIPTNYNASSAGPITVGSGVVVTVPSGSRWIII